MAELMNYFDSMSSFGALPIAIIGGGPPAGAMAIAIMGRDPLAFAFFFAILGGGPLAGAMAIAIMGGGPPPEPPLADANAPSTPLSGLIPDGIANLILDL